MLNLYKVSVHNGHLSKSLTKGEELSVYYHNLFDYPLSIRDLVRWKANDKLNFSQKDTIIQRSGYYYTEGKDGLIFKRLLRKRVSNKKLLIAKKAANYLRFIPSIRMVAITGSLAMENSSPESDIDFLIITKKGSLWLTRILVYGILKLANIGVRKAADKHEEDRLCLNMWMDESDLVWPKQQRNLYSAHEIAQIKPLVDKMNTYDIFLQKNKWILDFWPNAVSISKKSVFSPIKSKEWSVLKLAESIAFRFQVKYMRGKITREVVSKTRGIFHPQDWSKIVLKNLPT